jgi:hypothetical protein
MEGQENLDEGFEQVVGQAEEKFREGLRAVSDWGEQARDVMERQPIVALAGVALLGFLTGLVIREVSRPRPRRRPQ